MTRQLYWISSVAKLCWQIFKILIASYRLIGFSKLCSSRVNRIHRRIIHSERFKLFLYSHYSGVIRFPLRPYAGWYGHCVVSKPRDATILEQQYLSRAMKINPFSADLWQVYSIRQTRDSRRWVKEANVSHTRCVHDAAPLWRGLGCSLCKSNNLISQSSIPLY